jgi:hypothetical protein
MNQAPGSPKFTAQETQLIERLRQHPEMLARMQSILDLAHATDGPLKSADEVEELLIQELRELGRSTMNQWATQAEVRVGDELQSQDPTVRSRKKNADVVVCFWTGDRGRPGLAQPEPGLYPAFARTAGRDATGTVAAVGAGPDGLWL